MMISDVWIGAPAWVQETLGPRTWAVSKSDRPPSPRISILSFARVRAEARIACRTWAQQEGLARGDFEVVFAEFGENPSVFPDDASRTCFDSYVFAYMPNAAPYAASWWRNVAVWRARGKYALLVDGDIALSPRACATILGILEGHKCNAGLPAAVHPLRQLNGAVQVAPGAPYGAIIQGAGQRDTHESVWAFDTAAFKAMGGWPEGLTGWGGEENFFDPRAREAFCIIDAPPELFCHAAHPRRGTPSGLRNVNDRAPLLPGWSCGDPCLLDRAATLLGAGGGPRSGKGGEGAKTADFRKVLSATGGKKAAPNLDWMREAYPLSPADVQPQ